MQNRGFILLYMDFLFFLFVLYQKMVYYNNRSCSRIKITYNVKTTVIFFKGFRIWQNKDLFFIGIIFFLFILYHKIVSYKNRSYSLKEIA